MCKMNRLLYLLQFVYILNQMASLGLAQSTRQQVRLVGGNAPNEGRVEVYYQGVWGTVCDHNWDLVDAKVVCRQLGYLEASDAWNNGYFGQGSGLILLDNVNCYGFETSLADCSHDTWYTNDCSHGDDAGVTCSFSKDSLETIRLSGPSFSRGYVQMYPSSDKGWTDVCAFSTWTLASAQVACRQLGFSQGYGSIQYRGSFHSANTYYVYSMYCNGYEATLSECSTLLTYPSDTCHVVSVNCETSPGLSTVAVATIIVATVLGLIAVVIVITICLVYNKKRSQTAARSVPPMSAGAVPGTQQPLGPSGCYVTRSYPTQAQSASVAHHTQTQSVAYHVPSPYPTSVRNAQEPPPGFAQMPFGNQVNTPTMELAPSSNLAPQAAISQTRNPSSVPDAVSSDVNYHLPLPPQQGLKDPDQNSPCPEKPQNFPGTL